MRFVAVVLGVLTLTGTALAKDAEEKRLMGR